VNVRAAGSDALVRRVPDPDPDDGLRGRAGAADESSRVPFEQIGQSAVKRLWRQKSEFKA
jgi:hypothetical protein